MAVYVKNIVINTGETYSENLTLLDPNGDGPVNITGYALSSTIRKHPESIRKTADFVVGIANTLGGVVTLSLGSTITSSIKEGRYVYDVLMTNNLNQKEILIEGMVLVRSGISS